MKKRGNLLLLLMVLTFFATACSKADSDNDVNAPAGAAAQQGTIAGADTTDNSDTAENTGTIDHTPEVAPTDVLADTSAAAKPETLPALTEDAGTVESPESTTAPTVNEVNYTDDEFETQSSEEIEETDEGWAGVYDSQEGEQLSIIIDEADSISFQFTVSGIYGKAELSGNQAVFHGEDQHVVVFTRDYNVIEVEVLSEEDYDASESPLIGTYIRE